MKNRTLCIVCIVLAVVLYTMAVVNITLGNVVRGCEDFLFGITVCLLAVTLYRQETIAKLTVVNTEAFDAFLDKLKKGVDVSIIASKPDTDETPDTDEPEQADAEHAEGEQTRNRTTQQTGKSV